MENKPRLGSDFADASAADAARITTLTLIAGVAYFTLAIALGVPDAFHHAFKELWWLIVLANAIPWIAAFSIDWRVQRDLFGTTKAEVRAYYAHTERALKRAS